MDRAIELMPNRSDHYINRALVRYYRENLRGAMDDYDMALNADPKSFLGHYNRGLLRAQVGDDNRAIEDFDMVLSVDADNTPDERPFPLGFSRERCHDRHRKRVR